MKPSTPKSTAPDPVEEADLVDRCVGGSERAFADLVDRYKLMVYNLVDRIVCDQDATDDLAQEVFIKVHRGLPAFRGDAKLSTWIYRIAYRTCLEELKAPRSRQRFVPIQEEAGDPDSVALGVSLGGPDVELERVGLRGDLEHWMAELSPQHRSALTLYYLRERRYQEIAEIMNLPEGTVKTYLHRAKQYLRKRMLQEERAVG